MWSELKSRAKKQFKRLLSCLLGSTAFATAVAAFSLADLKEVWASDENGRDECMSAHGFSDELDFRFQTLLTWPPKRPTCCQPEWKPSKRRGKRRVVTTLYNIHSHESAPVFFKRLPPAKVLDNLFRCRGFGEERRVDPKLVDTLVEAAVKFKSPRVNIISAYRSPKFNDSLAKKGRRVAAESRHTRGKAIDFTLPDTAASKVGAWLVENFDGGVGIYKNDNFVHIDMGRKRRWYGK